MSYTFSLSRRSLPVRCLCLLLIVLVLWCFFMVPRAGAVALEATTIAYGGLLVGTILVGAGVVFSSHGDMAKVGAAMYKTLQKGNTAIASKIAAISVWAVDHGKAIGSAALRIGKDLYQGIVDAFNVSYSDGSFSVDSHSITLGDRSSDLDAAAESALSDWNNSRFAVVTFVGSEGTWKFVVTRALAPSGNEYEFSLVSYLNGVRHSEVTKYSQVASVYVKIGPYNITSAHVGLAAWNTDGTLGDVSYVDWCGRVDGSVLTGVTSVPVVPDLKYPSDDYLVRMPDIPLVDTATGDVTYPNDTAYTKDAVAAPYPIGGDGVKVPDIPFDIPVDQTSGKPMDDAGTDTDTPSKPGEGTGTGSNTSLLQKILDLLKNFFDGPSDFRLNMDGFRNLAIADKFPFCIPFDLVDSIKQFAVTAKDFHFRIKLDTHYFKVDHEVDLSDMVLPFAFFRYMVLVWFVWMLMLRTRDLVKW